MNGDFPTEEDRLIEHLETTSLVDFDLDAERSRTSTADLPEGTRQILKVERHTLINANWIVSATNRTTGVQASILAQGSPTPSSDVNHAYLHFVDAARVPFPRYNATRKRIDLFLDIRTLSLTLEQMKHTHLYVWVGHFAGGHIYGDVHSAP